MARPPMSHTSPTLAPQNETPLTASPRKRARRGAPPPQPLSLDSSPLLPAGRQFAPVQASDDVFATWQSRAADLGLSSSPESAADSMRFEGVKRLDERLVHTSMTSLADNTADDSLAWDFKTLGKVNMPPAMSSDNEMEEEYPPSPRKSPVKTAGRHPAMSSDDEEIEQEYPPSPKKSPVKRRLVFQTQPEAPRVTRRAPRQSSLGFRDFSPVLERETARKGRKSLMRRRKAVQVERAQDPLEEIEDVSVEAEPEVPASRPPGKVSQWLDGSAEAQGQEEQRREDVPLLAPPVVPEPQPGTHSMEDNLWHACGKDVQRWNMGDFDSRLQLGLDLKRVRW